MTTPDEPRPDDIALEQALPDQVEELEEEAGLEEQEEQPEPESVEAPDAG